MKAETFKLLTKSGLKVSLRGFEIVGESIELCQSKENFDKYRKNFTSLYRDLGEKYGSNAAQVERNMRHSIENAFKEPSNLMIEIFGSEKKRNNKNFVLTLSKYVELCLDNQNPDLY